MFRLLPFLACSGLAAANPSLDPPSDPWLSGTWLPLEVTQGVVAVQAEASLPAWLGVSASLGSDGRPFAADSPFEGALQLRYYFTHPFWGFHVGVFGGTVRTSQREWIHQAAPIAGYKWIANNGFTIDGIGGWSWVWGDRQQAGHLLYSVGLGYTW